MVWFHSDSSRRRATRAHADTRMAVAAAITLSIGRIRTIEYGVAPGDTSDGFAWHGQELQDCITHALLREKKNGTFVDLAANHWQIFSNTLSLERDHGWTGLCIEPNSNYHLGLLQNRTCDIVAAFVAKNEGPAAFSPLKGAGLRAKCANMSVEAQQVHYCQGSEGVLMETLACPTCKGHHRIVRAKVAKSTQAAVANGLAEAVWTTPFAHILARHNLPPIIDFLSLDVNGVEEAIMRALPPSSSNFTVVAIEAPSRGLKTALENRDYRFMCLLGHLDQIWVYWPVFQRDGADWAVRAAASNSSSAALRCHALVWPHATDCPVAGEALGRDYRVTGLLPAPTRERGGGSVVA